MAEIQELKDEELEIYARELNRFRNEGIRSRSGESPIPPDWAVEAAETAMAAKIHVPIRHPDAFRRHLCQLAMAYATATGGYNEGKRDQIQLRMGRTIDVYISEDARRQAEEERLENARRFNELAAREVHDRIIARVTATGLDPNLIQHIQTWHPAQQQIFLDQLIQHHGRLADAGPVDAALYNQIARQLIQIFERNPTRLAAQQEAARLVNEQQANQHAIMAQLRQVEEIQALARQENEAAGQDGGAYQQRLQQAIAGFRLQQEANQLLVAMAQAQALQNEQGGSAQVHPYQHPVRGPQIRVRGRNGEVQFMDAFGDPLLQQAERAEQRSRNQQQANHLALVIAQAQHAHDQAQQAKAQAEARQTQAQDEEEEYEPARDYVILQQMVQKFVNVVPQALRDKTEHHAAVKFALYQWDLRKTQLSQPGIKTTETMIENMQVAHRQLRDALIQAVGMTTQAVEAIYKMTQPQQEAILARVIEKFEELKLEEEQQGQQGQQGQ